MSSTRRFPRNLVTALLLAAAAWMLYFPSLHYGFVYYDDVRILQDHPELYGQGNLRDDLKGIFVTCYPREEPLLARDVSWAVDSRIFGFDNPFGYHLNNVLLHGIVVALLFVFLFGTTRRYGFSLATATAYLLLAVHTEPVAWIMGSKDILSALFMLLALCAQTRRLTSQKFVAQCGWYALTLACFLVALFSKINVLTFPGVLFLHAVLFPYLRGERKPSVSFPWRNALALETPLLAPCLAASAAVYVWYHRILAQMGIFNRGYAAHGLAHLWNLIMVNPLGFWMYLRQIFFPWNLSVLYTWPTEQASYPGWQIAAALATVAAIFAAGVLLFRFRKDFFFFYAAFFVLMVPYLNLIYIGIWVADRYVYFSSFCILAIAIFAVETLVRSERGALRGSVVAICLFSAGLNLYQKLSYEREWRNAETLWEYHIALPQPSVTAYENLSAYYYAVFSSAHSTNDMPLMVLSIRKMSAVVDAGLARFWPDRQESPPPSTSYLFFLKSLVQQVKGDPNGALQSLLISDRLKPEFAPTSLNLAQLYGSLAHDAATPQQRQEDLGQSRDRYLKYIALEYQGRPAPPAIRANLAKVEAECGGKTNSAPVQ